MRVPSGNRLGAAALVALAGHGGAARAARFADTFAIDRAPASLHASVDYTGANGTVHRMTVWRSGDRLLRRDTDRRLTTIVTHKAGDLAYRLDLFDHARRLHTIVDRESLYQVGTFIDWSSLAYGLQAPKGRYALRPIGAPPGPRPVSPCDWFELAQSGRTSRICWSRADAFPIMILDANGAPSWRVSAIDRRPLPRAIFRPDATGYILNNARDDMARD